MKNEKGRIMLSLTSQVKEEAKRLGARIVGVGAVDRWINAPEGHRPQDFLPNAKAVVAFGLPLFKAMTKWRDFMEGSKMFGDDDSEDMPNLKLAALQIYKRMQYDAVNLNLMSIANYLGCYLCDMGYQVITPPITGGAGFANEEVREMYKIAFHQWSQRHAAVAAGLGELGLNNAFICPEYGIRLRLGSLITDAPLAPDPLDKIGNTCDQCGECIKACPDPNTFGEQYSYELVPGYNLTNCSFRKELCKGSSCAACLPVCPVGK